MKFFSKALLAGVFALVAFALCGAEVYSPAAEAAKLKDSKIKISEADIKALGLRFEPIEVKIEGLKKDYDFIFISDLHVMADDDSELAENRKAAMIYRRDKHFNNPQSGLRPLHVWEKLPAILNKSNADAVFFCADMCDTGSIANVSVLRDGMKKLTVPFLYTREDHDASPWNLISKDVSKQNAINAEIDGYPKVKTLEFEDLIIFSHSTTYRHFSKERVEALRKECAKGKPVILVQHVPFVDQNNPAHKKLHAWNGRIKTNQPGTAALVKLLTAPNGPVKLIVSGHNHTNIDFMWTPTLRSRVFDAAFRGYVGIIKIRKK